MSTTIDCRGLRPDEINRRRFLNTTISLSVGGLALPTLLRAQARASETASRPAPNTAETAVIQLWLGGGPTHLETYDPKPLAPLEYRGPFGAISTVLPGVEISETLPRHARLLDKVAILRSVFHDSGDHDFGMYLCTTGKTIKGQPSTGSYAAKLRGPNRPSLPAYVHLGFQPTANLVFVPNFRASYLGGGYDPFMITDDPAERQFQVPNLSLAEPLSFARLGVRKSLLAGLDHFRRQADASGMMDSLDQFQRAAFDMVTAPAAREAFDLSQEDVRTRERYGQHRWGQSCLLARRLVESGVTFITVNFDPHSFSFDMHSNVKGGMQSAGPRMDAAITALVEDLYQRGLDRRVLVIAWGEFGRTPRINAAGGRDHWGQVMSVLVAGGGLRVGQVIGSSTAKGEVPKDRPLKPQDILATMYRHLGIDPRTTLTDHAGRPVPILNDGEVIAELI